MKIAVVAATSHSNEKGGAERLFEGLAEALNAAGHAATLVCVLSDESNFGSIEESLLRFYDLDLSAYDGVISTKAPSYLIRHHNHICFLLHTMRVFYDMFDHEFPHPNAEHLRQRSVIQGIDTAALSRPWTKKLFVIGHEVRNRLVKYNKLDAEVLYPALHYSQFKTGNYDYVFLPGRLHRWKRVDLVIRAMQYVSSPVRLILAGTGEDEASLRALAASDSRIEFVGRVSDQRLTDLYANCLCVPFVPRHEDFGYITLEAFHSEKPVITCGDAGEPTHIVRDGISGFICEPDPRAIGGKIDYFFNNSDRALDMGRRGKESVRHITWANVARTLMAALGENIRHEFV